MATATEQPKLQTDQKQQKNSQAANSNSQQLDIDYTTSQLIRRMTALAWRYKFHAIRLLIVQLVLLCVIISTLGFTGLGIDIIHKGFNSQAKEPNFPLNITPPATWSAMQTVGTLALIVLGLALLRFTLERFVTVWKSLLVQTMVVDLRATVYDKLQRLSFRFFDANESGSIINRVTSDVQGLRTFVDGVLLEFIVIALSLLMYIAFMLQLHVGLTIASLATTPIIYLLVVIFSRIVRPAYRENRRLFDSAVRVLSENVQGVHVVKGFGLQSQQNTVFAQANDQVADHKHFIFSRIATFIPVISFLPIINISVLLLYGSYIFIHNPTFTIGHLLIFAGLLHQFSEKIHAISQIANGMQRALTSAQRVFEIMDTPIEIQSPANPVMLERAKGKVTFKNTTFSYHDDEGAQPILNRINFTAEPGQCVAVLGATGSGKSTLLSLIPRFYDPSQGTVLIDDTDLRNYELFDLRRNIGIVFQESFLFSHSIAENIAFGHPEATREQIEEAAKIAQAHDFISNLEHGYDTSLKEGGNNLSGGQKQRLAIARALLLQPPILLLDDPTAAIDPETEHEILSAMDAAMAGRTTFVIAHRLSTLRRADHIIVLENGEIVEQGTHEQLMENGGHYRTAADLQIADPHSRQILGLMN